ncbi:MAG: oligosaccharide flippase family protein [Chitinivibrionales bacterium]|nr:oligosaccharide flippase family protein [Chitinivibrionales bacterium]
MGLARTIASNISALALCEIISRCLSLVLIMAMARYLGPEQMGVYAFASVTVGIFAIVLSSGMERFIERESARHPENSTSLIYHIFIYKAVLSLSIITIFIPLLYRFIDLPQKRNILILLTSASFFQSNFAALCSFFRAHQKTWLEGISRNFYSLVYTTSALMALMSGCGLITIVAIECGAHVLTFCFACWLFIKKIGPWKMKVTVQDITHLMSRIGGFFSFRIVHALGGAVDTLSLSLLAGDLYTGYYNAANRLLFGLMFIPNATSGGFLPVLSKNCLDPCRFYAIFKKYYTLLIVLGCGISALTAALSTDIVPLILGEKFKPAVTTFMIVTAIIVVIFINWPLSIALIALDKEKQLTYIFLVSLCVNALFCVIGIPIWKDRAAAVAVLCANSAQLVLQILILGFHFQKLKDLTVTIVKPFLGGVLTLLVTWLLRDKMAFFPLRFITGAVVYIIMLSILRVISLHGLRKLFDKLPQIMTAKKAES